MIVYLTSAIAVLAIMGVVFSAIGWRHSLLTWDPDEPEWWFSLAKAIYALAIGIRVLVWDVIWWPLHLTDREYAIVIVETIAILKVNFITVVLVTVGAYCSLKARQLLIPIQDRGKWPWWKSWMHPYWGFFRRSKHK